MPISYIRDKRSPAPKSEAVSRVMSKNRHRDTSPEIAVRKALWHAGHRGYRLHYKKIPGRPDVAFVGRKIAIFVHGCYWHRCSKCGYPLPKHNTEYWKAKFARNVSRDARIARELKSLGWRHLVVWECDVKKDLSGTIGKLLREMI